MDALELESAKQSPAIQTAKDLFSGAVGGIAQVLIGMFRSFFWFNATATATATAHAL